MVESSELVVYSSVLSFPFSDLKQELRVVDRVPCKEKDDSSSEIPAPVTNGHIIHPRGQVETETQTILSTPQKRESPFVIIAEFTWHLLETHNSDWLIFLLQ